MEDLTKNWNNLLLSEKEDTGDGSRGSYLQATLEICEWFQRPKFGRSYSAFCFDNSSDVERIFQNQPWSFDKHLVVLQKFDEYSKLKDLVFDKALFWVLGSGFKFMTSQSTSFLKGWRRVYVISWERSRDHLNQRMMMEAILYGFVSLLILIFPYAVDE